jgi:hypothetical protein
MREKGLHCPGAPGSSAFPAPLCRRVHWSKSPRQLSHRNLDPIQLLPLHVVRLNPLPTHLGRVLTHQVFHRLHIPIGNPISLINLFPHLQANLTFDHARLIRRQLLLHLSIETLNRLKRFMGSVDVLQCHHSTHQLLLHLRPTPFPNIRKCSGANLYTSINPTYHRHLLVGNDRRALKY